MQLMSGGFFLLSYSEHVGYKQTGCVGPSVLQAFIILLRTEARPLFLTLWPRVGMLPKTFTAAFEDSFIVLSIVLLSLTDIQKGVLDSRLVVTCGYLKMVDSTVNVISGKNSLTHHTKLLSFYHNKVRNNAHLA